MIARDDQLLMEMALTALSTVLDLPSAPALPAPIQAVVAPAARRGLHASSSEVRAASARCLRATGDAASPEALTQDMTILRAVLATNDAADVRLAALWALADLSRDTLPLLVERAASTYEHEDVRLAALCLLAGHPDLSRAHVEWALLPAVADVEHARVRVAALCVLLQVGSLEALRVGLDLWLDAEDHETSWGGEQAVRALLTSPIAARIELVQQALGTNSASARRWLFTSLLPTEHAQALRTAPTGPDVLSRAAQDEDWAVRAHAVSLLRGEGARWAQQMSSAACADRDARVRVRAVDVLASAPDNPAADVILRGCLNDSSSWVQVAALDGLTRRGRVDHAAVASALRETFPPMRRAALEAAQLVIDDADPVLHDEIARAAREAVSNEDPEVVQLGRELLRTLE